MERITLRRGAADPQRLPAARPFAPPAGLAPVQRAGRGPGPSPAGAEPIQRMVTPYTRADLGYDDAPAWLDQQVMVFRHQRAPISGTAKAAVNAFGDGDGVSTYKHYVPYDRIFKKLSDDMEGMSRGEVIGHLDTVNGALGIADTSGLDPQSNRAAFDAWVTWAVESICDWPDNLFRWPSAGDGGGTKVDKPTGAPPAALTTRLTAAAAALAAATGVSTA